MKSTGLGDATAAMDKRRVDYSDTGHNESADTGKLSGFLSAREAAAALGVNERTVRRAIARGDIAATRQGRAFRIAPAVLAAYRAPRPGRRRQRPAAARQPPPILHLVEHKLDPATA